MKAFTFKRGIHPPAYKFSEQIPLADFVACQDVYISMSQHLGKSAKPVVSVGSKVNIGTLIAEADGLISANVHSSICGEVVDISMRATPTGKAEHVHIRANGENKIEYLPQMADLSPKSIISRVKEAGIVGMGGAGFPTAVKLSPKSKVDTIIINAVECEPYITCDYRLILEYAEQVLKGASYAAKALELDGFIIGIEDNKPEAIELLNNLAGNYNAKVCVLQTKYPQGAEKQLIGAVLGRQVPIGKLPADVGAVVINASTAYAIENAIDNNMPLIKRPLTVTGGAISEKKNFIVPIGVKYSDIIAACGSLTGQEAKLISGGPMMGFAISTEEVAVTKTSNCILALTSEEANTLKPETCINCGACAKVCPMRLMPMYIDAFALVGNFTEAKRYGAEYCMECGSCAYTCPAKRTLVQSIRLAKRKIKELKV